MQPRREPRPLHPQAMAPQAEEQQRPPTRAPSSRQALAPPPPPQAALSRVRARRRQLQGQPLERPAQRQIREPRQQTRLQLLQQLPSLQ